MTLTNCSNVTISIGKNIEYVENYKDCDGQRQAANVEVIANDKSDDDRAAEAIDYLYRMNGHATEAYRETFRDVVTSIVQCVEVRTWLLTVDKRTQFRDFNKYNAYSICAMLRQLKVLDDFSDTELDNVLEGANGTSTYRKAISHRRKDAEKMAQTLKKIIFSAE